MTLAARRTRTRAILLAAASALAVAGLGAPRPAAWLLLPYLLWVAFAAALNLAVVRLNPPFGSA